MLWFDAKSSPVRDGRESWGWTSSANRAVSVTMDDATVLDPDVIDLVVQLCTRIGMIMEDASVLALDASHERLGIGS